MQNEVANGCVFSNSPKTSSMFPVLAIYIERVSIECRKTKTKELFWPIKKGGYNPVNQSKVEVITRSQRKARENVNARATIGFGFPFDWLKKWRENFEPITAWGNAKPTQFANYFRHSTENRSSIILKQIFLFWPELLTFLSFYAHSLSNCEWI